MPSWNLKSLREIIESRDTGRERPLELIGSIDRAIQIFRYHIFTAKDANDRITPETPSEAFDLVLTPTDKIEPIYQEKITIQANTQAAAHTARSIHDIFAQLVNCLILPEKIRFEICDLSRVSNKLERSKLKSHLLDLQASEDYSYVNAMVNTLKHRNLVPFGAQVSFVTDEAGVRFQPFEYNERQYPSLWAKEVLEKTLAVKNSVVVAGQLLNDQVKV